MTRVRRTILTVGAGFVGSIAVTLTGFVTTPILLRHLGEERFGIFRAASDWFGYVGLLEFGVSGGLSAIFSRALGKDDRAGVAAGVRAGTRAYLIVAILMLAVAVPLGAAMPALIRSAGDLAGEVRLGCVAYLAAFFLLPLAVFRPLIEAEQRGYIVQLVNTAQLFTAMVTSVGLAIAGFGVVGQFLGVVAGSVVFHLLLAWDGLRRHPEVIRGPSAKPPSIWAMSWPNFVLSVAGRLGLYTDNIMLAAFFGPSAVTPFVLTQRMILAAGTQVTGIGTAGWAGLIDLYFRGESAAFSLRLTQLTRLTAVVGAALLVPVAVWNSALIALWVGPDQYAGPAVTWLAASIAWGQAILSLWGWMLTASGRVRSTLPVHGISVAVNLAASAASTATFGLPGPLIGTAVAYAGVSGWWILKLLGREFGVAPAQLFGAAASPALLAAPYAVGLIFCADAVTPYCPDWSKWCKWVALIGWLMGSASGYLILAWVFVFPAADRRELVGRFLGPSRISSG